jgi:OOP family OmpA-OmpF porin
VRADRIESGRIQFDLYQGAVAPESAGIVDAVAARLRACPALQIEIQVHTDTVRTGAFNARQSQRVAEVLRERLVGSGVEASRLAACGYGESRPIVRQVDWSPESTNARVEWHVLPGPAAAHTCPSIE